MQNKHNELSIGFKIYRYLIAAIISFFPILALYLVLRDHITIPIWDEMAIMPSVLQRFLNGTSIWQDFWNTHNIHRLVLTNAIDFLTYFYLHAARLPLCLLQWATQTATFLFIAFQLNKIIAHTTIRYWLCLLFFAAFLFAPQMGLIWLWGYLIQQTMTPFFYILALFLLGYDDLKPRRDGIIATLAILCSLSSFNGLLIWPSIILLLLLGRAPWRAVMFYAALGAITMGVYAYHIGNLDQVVYSVTIFERLRYFLTFIGSMFSVQIINRGIKMGIIIVVVNLGLWLWFLFTKSLSLNQRRQLLPWLGMGIMTYGSAILGSIGRIENGLTQAMSDRYLPLSSPLWIGSLVVLLVLLYQVKKPYIKIVAILAMTLLSCKLIEFYSKNAYTSYMTALFYQNQSVLARAALEQNAYVINTPIPFGMLYPRLEVALDGLNKLKKNHLSLYQKTYPIILNRDPKDLGLQISEQKYAGTFESIDTQSRLNPESNINHLCAQGLRPSLFAAGDLALDNYKQISEIYIIDNNNKIVGLGFPLVGYEGTTAKNKLNTWLGFVTPSLITEKKPARLRAYARFKNSNQLNKMGEQTLQPIKLCTNIS